MASERKAGQGRLARIHGLTCLVSLYDILDAFDPEVYGPESRLRRDGYIISTKILFLFTRNKTYIKCLSPTPLDHWHGTNRSFVVSY
jgi:hypothetical protein